MASITEVEAAFWDVAAEFMPQDGVEEGTMFGFPCH